ncbi:MAG: hypothetical protein P8130_02125 [Deltaproteobacteria bacterium]
MIDSAVYSFFGNYTSKKYMKHKQSQGASSAPESLTQARLPVIDQQLYLLQDGQASFAVLQ